VRRPQAAGIMGRYAKRQSDARGPMAGMLLRAQRLDFSSWVDESLAHRRDTYVRIDSVSRAGTPRLCQLRIAS
jgi:hypothetical protein